MDTIPPARDSFMAKESKPSPAHERSSTHLLSRSQFRWLLLILCIHLLITIQTTYAPGVQSYLKGWWTERKQAAAKMAAVQHVRANEQQAMNFLAPANKVIWEEDPDAGAALVSGAGYRWIPVFDNQGGSGSLFPNGDSGQATDAFPRGACSLAAPALSNYKELVEAMEDGGLASSNQHNDVDGPAAFLHGRKSASGSERLVWVFIRGSYFTASDNAATAPDGGEPAAAETTQRRQPFGKTLSIIAIPIVPGNGEKPPRILLPRQTQLYVAPLNEVAGSWTRTPPSGTGSAKMQMRQTARLRVFAGQPDASDASHFTIAYDVDGQAGKIEGMLKDDDTVELRPTTGALVGDRWDPHGK